MRATVWEYVVIGLVTGIAGVASATREPTVGAAWGGAFWGLLLGILFCILVRLVMLPLQRELEALRGRVAELEQRAGGPGGSTDRTPGG